MTVLEEQQIIESQSTAAPLESSAPADWQPYRAVSRSAVVALVLAVLGTTLGLLFPAMLVLCLLGIFAGFTGMRSIKRHPLEYTGLGIARTGLVLSAIGLTAGLGLHTFVYLTEVPEGFERVSFYDLRPANPKARPIELPERAIESQGKNIFVKGYIHPGVQGMGRVKHFILVPDMGTCCFGGQPDPTDMIEVTLETAEGVRYSTSLRKLAGKFELAPPRSVKTAKNGEALTDVIYKLDATYVQ